MIGSSRSGPPSDAPQALLPRLERYPQKVEPSLTPFDATILSIVSYLRPLRGINRTWGPQAHIVKKVDEADKSLPQAFEECLALLPMLRARLRPRRFNLTLSDMAPLLAVIRRSSEVVLGQKPYSVQIAAVGSLLKGEVAEMRTGEGKSLTAAVASAALAFTGRQVHVLTVNDYLAERDAERFLPLFELLGLSCGCITEEQSPDDRRLVYQRDVVFSAAKNIVFDYLRDQTGPSAPYLSGLSSKLLCLLPHREEAMEPILQGLDCVVIDEADSVLVDQAATPFILSGGLAALGGLDQNVLARALFLCSQLQEGVDFKCFEALRRASLTDHGKVKLAEKISADDGLLAVAPIREHIASQALVALHLLRRNRDYLIEDDKIQIIDESTGRVMPDRQWSEGLHQLVELKEGLDPSDIRTTLGRITFQRFFPRYRHICGMSGTALPAARELWESYGLQVRKIKPRRPDRRIWSTVKIFPTTQDKWSAISDYVLELYKSGKPVLIGTRTVEASRACSAALAGQGIKHHVLNAEEAAREAMIVALAGEPGQVTVATNMAGRGTDIVLSDHAKASGGLHVILSELHENRRIDLQLAGRCGRQGDPGHVYKFLSLDDTLFMTESQVFRSTSRFLYRVGQRKLVYGLMLFLQGVQTRRAEASRRRLQKYERQRERSLALSGALE